MANLPDNKCGSCTQCCRLMGIKELHKPQNRPCPNCTVGVGCNIYAERPPTCQSFKCIWLQTQDGGPGAMPLKWRPDKSKIVLHLTPDEKHVVAKVDPHYPQAWQDGPVAAVLLAMSSKVLVLIDNGRDYWLIDKCRARQVQMSAPDAEGNEHFVGYC